MSKSLVELMWDLPEGKVATPRSVFTSLPKGHRLPVVLSSEELEVVIGLRAHLHPNRFADRSYLGRTRRSSTSLKSAVPSGSLDHFLSSSSYSQRSVFSCGSNGHSKLGRSLSPRMAAGGQYMEFVNLDDINAGRESRTLYMIRRLPRYISVDQLCFLTASSELLSDAFDLIYVPVFTGKAHANRGYAFMNFKSPQLGALFLTIVKQSTDSDLSRQLNRCDIVYAHIQSRDDMISNLSRIRSDSWYESNADPTAPSLPPGLMLF